MNRRGFLLMLAAAPFGAAAGARAESWVGVDLAAGPDVSVFTVTSAGHIQTAVISNAKIVNLTAAKIVPGSILVGEIKPPPIGG
jgi:hypothetical protein